MTLKLLKLLISPLLVMVLAAGVLAEKTPQVSDDVIYDMVKRKLANDPDVKGGALTVTVKDAVVTLNGQVELQKQKERAAKLVKKIKGVRSVNNQLTIIGKAPR